MKMKTTRIELITKIILAKVIIRIPEPETTKRMNLKRMTEVTNSYNKI